MVLLARREIDLLEAGGRPNLNKALAEVFPSRTLEAIKGVRKRPAYKELLMSLTTSNRTQDGASSLPSEGPSLGSETQPASLEEGTRDWASDLKKVVEESGINLDGLRLDDIEPGVPSDWVREAIDLNYEVWLPAPAEAGRSQHARAPAKEPEGARAKRRAQYARVQRCYDKDRTRCAQQIIAGNWREPPASLPMSVKEPFWRDIFETPSVPDSRSLPVVGELHWELLHPITSEDVVGP